MPLARRNVRTLADFNISVSYKLNERKNKLRDALNVTSNQGRLETRHGFRRYNDTSLGGAVLSQSFFKDTSGNQFFLSKVGGSILSVASSGASSAIKTGLTATTKHRGLTLNNRHIMAADSDGLFQYDGTNFTQLGQAAPTTLTAAKLAGGALTDAVWIASITFYSSTNGFETNAFEASSVTTSASDNTVALTAIPATAANATIDKVRVYVSQDAGSDLFVAEIALGVTTYNIVADPTSTQVPPTTHAAPIDGGGKYLTEFNTKLVYAGNGTYKNDVFFSEAELPDAFDDTSAQLVLNMSGDGDITGLATGFYNNSILDPYLVIFKRKSTHIYSERDDFSRLVTISMTTGCVSNETIVVKNGDIYFLSEKGWKVIRDGRFAVNEQREEISLAGKEIDDIFTRSGYVYELNKAYYSNFFSVYYPTLDQYITWTFEGASSACNRAYNYEFDIGGFKPFGFSINCKSAMLGEDDDNSPVVFLGDSDGYLYTYTTDNVRTDTNAANTDVSIAAFALTNWIQGDDQDASYNFRELILRAITNTEDLNVKGFTDYELADFDDYTYSFPDPGGGFILDISRLDEGILGDGDVIVTARADINRVGENLLIGFYQTAADSNINLISAQIHYSKNGNRN